MTERPELATLACNPYDWNPPTQEEPEHMPIADIPESPPVPHPYEMMVRYYKSQKDVRNHIRTKDFPQVCVSIGRGKCGRPLFIDGLNLGYNSGNTQYFDWGNIEKAVYLFVKKYNSPLVKVVLPKWRQETPPYDESDPTTETRGSHCVAKLDEMGVLLFIKDEYFDTLQVLELALRNEAFVVTNDNYSDVYDDTPYKHVIDARIPWCIIGGAFTIYPHYDPEQKVDPAFEPVFFERQEDLHKLDLHIRPLHGTRAENMERRMISRPPWTWRK